MEKIDQSDSEEYQIAFKMSSGHVILLFDWPTGDGEERTTWLQIFGSLAHFNQDKGSDEPVVNIILEKGEPIDPDVDNGNATAPEDEDAEDDAP